MPRTSHVLTLLAGFLLLLGGCQHSGEEALTPTSPRTPDIAGVAQGVDPGRAMLAAYDLVFNGEDRTPSLAPQRSAEYYGDSYWLNATGFVKTPPCHDCLRISGFRYDANRNLQLTVKVKHPFPAGDPGLPASGSNRLDLHLFDAQIMLACELSDYFAPLPDGGAIVSSRGMLDADGLSGLLFAPLFARNPATTQTVFPYKAVHVDPTPGNFSAGNPNGFADVVNPTGYNVFPMGAEAETTFTIGLAPEDLEKGLQVYFTANYGVSVNNRFERLDPKYACPEFNAKAPWKVEVEIPDATNNLGSTDTSSTAEIIVRVWDWQAGATVDPTLSDIGAVRAASEPLAVNVVAANLFDGYITLDPPVSGTGQFDDPLIYVGELRNVVGSGAIDIYGAVQVRDSHPTHLNRGPLADVLSTFDGKTIEEVDIPRYQTFQSFKTQIGVGDRVPNRVTMDPADPQVVISGPGGAIDFTATGHYASLPFTQDLTDLAVWDSSDTEAATFTGTTLTGIRMGVTEVTAMHNGVTSDPRRVYIKPVSFFSEVTSYTAEMDAHQGTGDFYMVRNSPHEVAVYNIFSTEIDSWPIEETHIDTVNGTRPWGITINEAAEEVFVAGGYFAPLSNNVAVYGTDGLYRRGYAIEAYNAAGNQTITGLTVMESGLLLHPDFVGRPSTSFDVLFHEALDGSTLGGFDIDCVGRQPCFRSPVGADDFGDLLVISDPGGRDSAIGRAISVVDPVAGTILASAGERPLNTDQNEQIAFDRDGLIHVCWSGSTVELPPDPQIQVWEYVAPDVLEHRYTYRPLTPMGAEINIRGIAISRPTNLVVAAYSAGNASPTSSLVWFY